MRFTGIIVTAILCMCGTLVTAQEHGSECFQNDMVQAVVWQQTSGEYRALCFQAYNSARNTLDNYLRKKRRHRRMKPCVVVDVDETVLNNSPYSGYQIAHCKGYSKDDWHEWAEQAAADTVPGSFSFLKYAASKGVSVFYITNRHSNEQGSTIRNLQHYGFPDADAVHVLTADSSDKEPRRKLVEAEYEIVLFCGDNLNDFNKQFYRKNVTERNKLTDELSGDFGRQYIVLPNPLYGDWEQALYRDGIKRTPEERGKYKRKVVKTSPPTLSEQAPEREVGSIKLK